MSSSFKAPHRARPGANARVVVPPSPQTLSRRGALAVMAGFTMAGGFILHRARTVSADGTPQREGRPLVIRPRRGAILDRRGEILAASITLYRVALDAERLAQARRPPEAQARLLAKLAGALGLEVSALRARLAAERTLVLQVSPIQARDAGRLGLGASGVHITSRTRRVHPRGRCAAHVLGFLHRDGSGAEGLERLFHTDLKGADDAVPVVRDGRGRPIAMRGSVVDRSAQGASLWLTLDAELQDATERILRERVEAVQARAGHVVVMEPRTGAILALTSYPAFHPSHPGDVDAHAHRNRAVSDSFEPGSVVKTFTVAGALEADAIRPDQRIDCQQGRMHVGTPIIHDTHPHGLLTPAEIVARSSNIGAAIIGAALGRGGLERTLRAFGFGAQTGIELPAEAAGMLRPHAQWHDFDAATMAFGQGMMASNIQLATAMAAIANGGVLMRPFLVTRVVDGDGKTVAATAPLARRRVVREHVARQVREMLVHVTERGGTAPEAALEGVDVAGKTGTAQQATGRGGYVGGTWTASFVGFAPAVEPRAVISVVLDAPRREHTGGAVAGPVFREIARALLGQKT